MVKKKLAPRYYDEWQPELTPTGRVSKKSQLRLNEIRAQKIAEKAAEVDLDEVIELGSFVGVTALFYYGINPVMLDIFAKIGGIAEGMKDIVVESSKIAVEVLQDPTSLLGEIVVVTPSESVEIEVPLPEEEANVWTALQIDELLSDKRKAVESNKKKISDLETKIEKAYGTIDNIYTTIIPDIMEKIRSREELGGREEDIERYQSILEHLESEINRLNKQIDIWKNNIDKLNILNLELEDQISQGQIDSKEAKKLEKRARNLKIMVSIGQAGIVRWVMKSYEPYEIIENATITG